MRAPWIIIGFALLSACTHPATSLEVTVDSDSVPGTDFDWIPPRQSTPNADWNLEVPESALDLHISSRGAQPTDQDLATLPFSFGVAPHDDAAKRRVRIVVRACKTSSRDGSDPLCSDADPSGTTFGTPVLETQVITGFRQFHTLRVPLFLWRSCRGRDITCEQNDPNSTCLAGACTSATVATNVLPPATHQDPPDRLVELALGKTFGCARAASGRAFCWGADESMQVGSAAPRPGSSVLPPVAVPIVSPVTAIAAGDSFACAQLATGGVSCWGANDARQLGRGDTSGMPGTPATVPGLGGSVVGVAAGGSHACAIVQPPMSMGRLPPTVVWCWGDNAPPALVDGISGVVAIAAGAGHTCAITQDTMRPDLDGNVWCWGRNDFGQASPTNTVSVSVGAPTAVTFSPHVPFATLAAGATHTCAASTSGATYCWGNGMGGGLNGMTSSSSRGPIPVLRASPAPSGSPLASTRRARARRALVCGVGADARDQRRRCDHGC